jgi:hypothetical protein
VGAPSLRLGPHCSTPRTAVDQQAKLCSWNAIERALVTNNLAAQKTAKLEIQAQYSNDRFFLVDWKLNVSSVFSWLTAMYTLRVAANCFFAVLNWSAGKPTVGSTRFGS